MYSLVPLIWATAADDNLSRASCISGEKLSIDVEFAATAATAAAAANAFWLFNRLATSCAMEYV